MQCEKCNGFAVQEDLKDANHILSQVHCIICGWRGKFTYTQYPGRKITEYDMRVGRKTKDYCIKGHPYGDMYRISKGKKTKICPTCYQNQKKRWAKRQRLERHRKKKLALNCEGRS